MTHIQNHHLAYKKWGPGWMHNVTWFSNSHCMLIKKELTISHLQWNHPKKVESRSFAFEPIKPYTTPQFKNSPLNGYHPRRVVGVSIWKRISFQERAVKLPGKYRVVPQQSPGPHRTSTVARRTTSKATAQTSHLARCSDAGSQPPLSITEQCSKPLKLTFHYTCWWTCRVSNKWIETI